MLRVSLMLLVVASIGPNAAATTPEVQKTLGLAAARLEEFFVEATQLASHEHVEQQKFNPNGKVVSRKGADYDYLVLMQLAGNELLTHETRELRGNAEKQPSQPLLLTRGFALLCLVLHPHFQSSFLFADEPSPVENARGLRRLAFTFLPGARSPSVLQSAGKNYPIPWRGVVWVEETTGAVIRIQAELGERLSDLGLETMTANVEYGPTEFSDPAKILWLPKQAVVEVRTQHQHWRNVHTYADYRRFQVTTTMEVGKPKDDNADPSKP
jgi:hypothetical protein